MKAVKILILVMTLMLVSMPAFAQRRPFDPEQGAGGAPTEERREAVRKKIEAIRIWRMTEELKLDSSTSAKLASLLSPIEQKRREIMRAQFETMRTLRHALAVQKPDEGKIKPLLEKLESSNNAMQDLRITEIRGLKEILTVEQQARFLIFQRDFEREMREMIAGARGGRQGRSDPGGTGPAGRDFRGPGARGMPPQY